MGSSSLVLWRLPFNWQISHSETAKYNIVGHIPLKSQVLHDDIWNILTICLNHLKSQVVLVKSHFFIVSFPRKWWPSRHPTLSLKRLNGPGVWSPSAAPWSTCHPWNGRRPSKSCAKPGRKARIILYHYMILDYSELTPPDPKSCV